jgi:hypothetical protein
VGMIIREGISVESLMCLRALASEGETEPWMLEACSDESANGLLSLRMIDIILNQACSGNRYMWGQQTFVPNCQLVDPR